MITPDGELRSSRRWRGFAWAVLALMVGLLLVGTLAVGSSRVVSEFSPFPPNELLLAIDDGTEPGGLSQGRVLFNPPRAMRLESTKRVEVRVTRAAIDDLTAESFTKGLRGEGVPTVEPVQVGPVMSVTLGGTAFDIQSLSASEQLVPLGGFAQWEYNVTALEPGRNALVLSVTAIVTVDGRDRNLSVPVLEREIDVVVGGMQRVTTWWSRNWQWSIATLVAIATLALSAVALRNRARFEPLVATDPRSPSVRVFISYRRSDTAAWAGRLHDRLVQLLGPDQVFMDVVDILPGKDFSEVIASHIATSDGVLVAIGRSWLSVRDGEGRRRLDVPGDHVATEVRLALDSEATVVPVLFDEASMPTTAELPESIEGLSRRSAKRIDADSFAQDVEDLVAAISLDTASTG